MQSHEVDYAGFDYTRTLSTILGALLALLLTIGGWLMQNAYASIADLNIRIRTLEVAQAVDSTTTRQIFDGQSRIEKRLDRIEEIVSTRAQNP